MINTENIESLIKTLPAYPEGMGRLWKLAGEDVPLFQELFIAWYYYDDYEEHLDMLRSFPPEDVPRPVWDAVFQFAENPETYDGSAHLKAAKAVQTTSPELAFTMLANAAIYNATNTKQKAANAIEAMFALSKKK